MDVHIIVRARNRTAPTAAQRAGTCQLSVWRGPQLQAQNTTTLWWKGHYVHTRVPATTSLVELEFPPNQFTRLFHFGFSVELIRNSHPIYFAEFGPDEALSRGFTVRIRLETLLSPIPLRDNSQAIVVRKQPADVYPIRGENY